MFNVRYETIVSWMEQLAADNPSFVSVENLGESHEGRKILLLKVGTSPRGAQTRAVWVDGGIHAREVREVQFLQEIEYSFPVDCAGDRHLHAGEDRGCVQDWGQIQL